MKPTKDFVIPATVAETGEEILVDNRGPFLDNPWGFSEEIWFDTADGRTFHKDELVFKE